MRREGSLGARSSLDRDVGKLGDEAVRRSTAIPPRERAMLGADRVMNATPDLQRFLDAQASSYATIVSELSRGRKESHWIWFAFPQAAGLGMSATSQRYAIRS